MFPYFKIKSALIRKEVFKWGTSFLFFRLAQISAENFKEIRLSGINELR